MRLLTANSLAAIAIIATGLAIAAAGIYVGETDDAPGAGIGGIVIAIGLTVWGVKVARRDVAR
jgi:hypothetical protein